MRDLPRKIWTSLFGKHKTKKRDFKHREEEKDVNLGRKTGERITKKREKKDE
ncbi:MAG: hypothetical protein WAN36_11460 [Calditrichia bacterium]